MGDPDRMERGFDLAPPVVEKLEQHREIGREIVFLPDKQLQKRGRVGTVEMDLCRRQAVTLQLCEEASLGHCIVCAVPGPWSKSRIAARISSIDTARLTPGGFLIVGWSRTADRSDAQDARMARFTSGSRLG